MSNEPSKKSNDDGVKEGENGTKLVKSGKSSIACISIIGQIEGHYALEQSQKATKYDHIIPALVALEEDDGVDAMLLLINTLGGDVEAGLAISEVIAGLSKPTASIVLGGGHSIGVPLAVSADRSFIVPSATMTIHPVRVNGLVLGVPQAFSHFQRMQQRIVDFVCAHSRLSSTRFNELCFNMDELATDVGSVLGGAQAVEEGLIQEVGGIHQAFSKLKEMIDESSESI